MRVFKGLIPWCVSCLGLYLVFGIVCACVRDGYWKQPVSDTVVYGEPGPCDPQDDPGGGA